MPSGQRAGGRAEAISVSDEAGARGRREVSGEGERVRREVLGEGEVRREVLGEGERVRREVLGDAHVDRAQADTTELTAPFQDFITRYAWGEVWARPGLDRRTRSAITLTALTALGRENELAMHVRGALRNGLSPEEIGEVLLHTAVYAGVPAANAAFAIARSTIEAETTSGGSGDPPDDRP
ncbi:MAG: 4-carboxymuconolactone decarboxylase [Solirubrobacterales bacterium]|nr:4-carboxymuconolactone decarboxylase [Solirubrobacterales bacterium]